MKRIKRYEPLWKKWTVTKLIGEGSFGAVYEAECDILGNKSNCAVKLISFRDLGIPRGEKAYETLSPEELEKIKIEKAKKNVREVVFMDKLQGRDHIVTIYDYDIFPRERTTDIIIRMELLTNLDTYMKMQQITSEKRLKEIVVKLGKDICKALKECEEEKIVHRDIKPENIFVNKDGTFKLGDFGLSKELRKTVYLSRIQGTPLYMSPEAFDWHQKTDYRSDIYSLGIVLYVLLNDGKIPFASDEENFDEEESAIKKRIDGEECFPPKHDDGELWKIVKKACQFKKEDRYQHAEEMLKDLEKLKNEKSEETIVKKQPKKQRNANLVLGYNIGDTIILGSYPQDEQFSEKQEIEWIILDREKNKLLLVSKYILDVKPYHKSFVDITWGASDIRKWLNDEFYNIAFDYSEQKRITYTFTKTKKKTTDKRNRAGSTADKVFLLDKEEAEKFFPIDFERQASATEYVKKQGIYIDDNTGQSPWWLRTSGYEGYNAVNVNETGSIYSYGNCIEHEKIGIRPALWMNLEE